MKVAMISRKLNLMKFTKYKCNGNEQIFEVKFAKMLKFIFIKKSIFNHNQQILEEKISHMFLIFSFLKKYVYLRENVKSM